MKAGELTKMARAYGEFLPPPWKQVGYTYRRHAGHWVQLIVFYTSSWADKYEPRSCLEFLKEPGEVLCGYLVQGLVHERHGNQRWVSLTETARSLPAVFEDMARQFKPNILAPLNPMEVQPLLEADLEYWPHPYALCVMAAEAGNKTEAEKYFTLFRAALANPTLEPVVKARKELESCIKQAGTETLHRRLARIQAAKLRALKLGP